MISIREATFESNSSSTHCLTMTSESNFEDWKNGKVLYDIDSQRFYEKSEIYEQVCKELSENLEESKKDFESRENPSYWLKVRVKELEELNNTIPTKEVFEDTLSKLISKDCQQLQEAKLDEDSEEFKSLSDIEKWICEAVGYTLGRLFTCSSYYDYIENEYETFEDTYNGVVAFGYFGYN